MILSIENINILRKHLLDNAGSLLEESKILFENGKFARSYTLAHYASEELAKIPMLASRLLEIQAGKEVDWRKLNMRFTNHNEKLLLIRELDKFIVDGFKEISHHPFHKTFNKLKNLSIYAGIENNKPYSPISRIPMEYANLMISLSELRMKFISDVENNVRDRNPEEIDKIQAQKLLDNADALVKKMR